MLNVNYNGSTYPVKNRAEEFLIKDFENVTKILNDKKKNNIDKWSETFVYCGLPQDIVDEFDAGAFIQLVKEFNILDGLNIEISKEIELNGEIYTAYDDEFKMTVKDMRFIEDYIVKNDDRYLGELMAVIYKRKDLDKSLHYDKSHIHFKAELFRKEVTADKTIPFIQFLSKKLVQDYELIKNGI